MAIRDLSMMHISTRHGLLLIGNTIPNTANDSLVIGPTIGTWKSDGKVDVREHTRHTSYFQGCLQS